MKNIFFTNISEVGKQKVPLKAKQGMSLSKTPAPQSEKIYGSNVNKKGSSSSLSSAKNIKLTDKTMTSIKNLVKTFNKKNPDKKITVPAAKAVVRRGMGAYSSTHRPTITGGKPNSRVAWGLARLKAFLYKAEKGKSKSGNYVQDDDLFKELGIRVKSYETGGELEKGIKAEKEHSKTIHDIYTHKIPENKAFEAIAKDHIKENPNYYSDMNKYADGGLIIGGVEVNNGDTGVLATRKGDINITIKNITPNWVIFIDEEGKRKDNPRDKFIENFTPSQGGTVAKTVEPGNIVEKGLPSTDPETWNGEFKVGDKVKIRWDYSNDLGLEKTKGFAKVDYFSSENNFTVVHKGLPMSDNVRPENPTGVIYMIDNGQGWEGKDLELVVVDNKQSPQQTVKQQKTTTTKTPKVSKVIEEEEPETPVYFDKEADFVKVYENFLQNNSEIEDYSLISQAEVIQNISSNFEISVENLKKEVEEIKNKPKITEPEPQPTNATTKTSQKVKNLDPVIIPIINPVESFSEKLEFTADETVELKAQYDLRVGDTIVSIGQVFNAIKLGEMYCIVPGADQSLFLVKPHDVIPTMQNSTILIDREHYMYLIKEKIETKDYYICNQDFDFNSREVIVCEVVMPFNALDSTEELEDYSKTELYDFVDIGPYLIFSWQLAPNRTSMKVNLIPKEMVNIEKYGSSFYEDDVFEDAKILEKIEEGDYYIAQMT